MSSKPILVVTGATGAQGKSVINASIADGNKWALRALTRNTDSPSSKELLTKGVELVKGDLNNVEDLRKLFKGATAVFALTPFWDPSVMQKEFEIGKSMADVAKETGVKRFVFSSLADAGKISNKKYHVPHFTDKAHIEDYIKKKLV